MSAKKKPAALTGAQKIAAYRKRQHAAGLHEVYGCWLPKTLHSTLKAYSHVLSKITEAK